MPGVRCRIAGFDRLRSRIAALPAAAGVAVGSGLRDLAERAAIEVRHGLAAARASAAPPLAPSDSVAAAVTVEATEGGGSAVVIDLPLAQALEFGTARSPARPILRPASEEAAREAKGMLASSLDQAMKRTGR